MKRLIIAKIQIEMDSELSDYSKANIDLRWQAIVSDYLATSEHKIRSYCSILIDEVKEKTNTES